MGCKGGCFSCGHRCERFFVQFQSNFLEENEFSPQFIQNRPDGGVTEKWVTELLEGYVETGEFDELGVLVREIVRVVGNPSDYSSLAITLLGDLAFRYGVNVVDALSGLPVDRQSVVANLSGDSALSLSAAMRPGQVINIRVNPSAALKVMLPTSVGWTLMDESVLELSAGETAEINIWCVGSGEYSVKTYSTENFFN